MCLEKAFGMGLVARWIGIVAALLAIVSGSTSGCSPNSRSTQIRSVAAVATTIITATVARIPAAIVAAPVAIQPAAEPEQHLRESHLDR